MTDILFAWVWRMKLCFQFVQPNLRGHLWKCRWFDAKWSICNTFVHAQFFALTWVSIIFFYRTWLEWERPEDSTLTLKHYNGLNYVPSACWSLQLRCLLPPHILVDSIHLQIWTSRFWGHWQTVHQLAGFVRRILACQCLFENVLHWRKTTHG